MITAGVDVGTRFLKVCIVEDAKLIGSSCCEMNRQFDRLYRHTFRRALEMANNARAKKIRGWSVKKIVATGYGAKLVKKGAHRLSEPVCLARGAWTLDNSLKTIIDVGGFFIRVVTIDGGGFVEHEYVNEKCAAGSGKFLEMIAEAIEMPFEQISSFAEKSTEQFNVAGNCAVFAESSVISQVNAGKNKNDVIAGVIDSIASKTTTMFSSADADNTIVLSGGLARLPAFIARLEKMAGCRIKKPDIDPQLIPAFGAGIIAGGNLINKKNGGPDD